jgi:class 3 adenylate cyclase
MLALADADWEFYSEATAHGLLGWSAGEEGPRLAAALREGQTPAALRAAFETMIEIDVSDLLSQIATPTLVLHQRDALHPEVGIGRRLVARIPNAQLVVLHGKAHPYFEESEPFFRAIDEFLGGVEPATDEAHARTGLVTILFTDLASSTALTQRLGDAKAQELVRAHNSIVREALAAQGGTEIKHTGDGIMASFPSASGALECAVAIQRGVSDRADPDLQVHIGLNAGEPVADEGDLFGTSVQLARRICDHAEAGQILVSNVVRELSAGKGFLFADRGEVVPKGFDEAVRLYEVRWRKDGG